MRAVEGLATRNTDIDFSVSPTKIHLRKEYSKTKKARDIYISDECTQYLKQWLDWKYKNPDRKRTFNEQDLVFTVSNTKNPVSLYAKVWKEFERLLTIVNMDQRKEAGISGRRKITMHSLRRHAKTVISEQAGTDFSEFFLGHAKSPYWTMKESKRREIYKSRVMKYLTFLDYEVLETTGKNIEAQLTQKEMEIQLLRQRDLKHETEMLQLQNQLDKQSEMVMKERQQIELKMNENNSKLDEQVSKLDYIFEMLTTGRDPQNPEFLRKEKEEEALKTKQSNLLTELERATKKKWSFKTRLTSE